MRTAWTARRNNDLTTFKKVLSTRTLVWLETEANRANTTPDGLLAAYLDRQEGEEVPESSGERKGLR
jgi:hypothetical protein